MPAHQIEFLLTRRPRLVAVARRRVAARVQCWGHQLDADTKGTLDLLVSELVTNAVLHATGVMISVRVRLDGQRLLVGVEDDSPEPPGTPAEAVGGDLADWERESGRGLLLIHALAAEHGWEPTARGKRVWFALVLPAAPTRVRAATVRRAARAVRGRLHWPMATHRGPAADSFPPLPAPA
ncbi:ATP-binding protein [Streptacidiphilus anmyonensis]|uniref:ATP-binding protein n=1 Tax=Streptacidiphilus anmyonensis TaxID=405782 RepID=UPI0006934C1A|nr:ATP-binding protein [Streptacidiphilus anmyonensis]